ncbi:MAG: hypothetical protein ACK4E0_15560 [Chitinophagaceae bacterium]
MKKNLFLASLALALGFSSLAQNKAQAPPPPPPPEPPKVELKKFTPPRIVKDEGYEAFLSRNKEVNRLIWKDGQQVTVVRNDKTKEQYNLAEQTEKKKFVEKYGEPPVPPPPPPPAPPTAPKKEVTKA